MTTATSLLLTPLQIGPMRRSLQSHASLAHVQHVLAGVRTRLAQHERLAVVATRMARAFEPVEG